MALSLRKEMWANGWLRRYNLTENRKEEIGQRREETGKREKDRGERIGKQMAVNYQNFSILYSLTIE